VIDRSSADAFACQAHPAAKPNEAARDAESAAS
jgi:hypothetical protein